MRPARFRNISTGNHRPGRGVGAHVSAAVRMGTTGSSCQARAWPVRRPAPRQRPCQVWRTLRDVTPFPTQPSHQIQVRPVRRCHTRCDTSVSAALPIQPCGSCRFPSDHRPAAAARCRFGDLRRMGFRVRSCQCRPPHNRAAALVASPNTGNATRSSTDFGSAMAASYGRSPARSGEGRDGALGDSVTRCPQFAAVRPAPPVAAVDARVRRSGPPRE